MTTATVETKSPLLERLDTKLANLIEQVERTPLYQTMFDPNSDPELSMRLLRTVLLQSSYWVPPAIEAIYTATGRMPYDRPRIMRKFYRVVEEEITHPKMAFDDYVRMGGEPSAKDKRMPCESFQIVSLYHALATREHPFTIIGAFYLSEASTPILTERLHPILGKKEFKKEQRRFIDLHAVDDIEHSQQLAAIIEEAAGIGPEAEEAIEYGFDCYASIYPIPLWNRVYEEVTGKKIDVTYHVS